MTKGKGRNRKILNAEAQTLPITTKSRHTFCPKAKTKTKSAFASNWEMYDTYLIQEQADRSSSESSSSESGDFETVQEDTASMDSYRMSADERDYVKLLKNPRFLEAVCVIERLLANNCYNEQQKIFRGLTVQDDFREDIVYQYNLNYLWTFANENTKGR